MGTFGLTVALCGTCGLLCWAAYTVGYVVGCVRVGMGRPEGNGIMARLCVTAVRWGMAYRRHTPTTVE